MERALYDLDTGLETRSICFENPTGERGAGGRAASPLGPGRKGDPARVLAPGEEVVLADIAGSGTIRHIWLTGPMSASEFLDALAVATGWNIASSPKVREVVLEFWTNEITPAQALAILRFNEVFYEYDKEANFLFVLTKEEHMNRAFGSLVQTEFTIRYADLASVETVLTSLLSSKGRLIADPATSKIIDSARSSVSSTSSSTSNAIVWMSEAVSMSFRSIESSATIAA